MENGNGDDQKGYIKRGGRPRAPNMLKPGRINRQDAKNAKRKRTRSSSLASLASWRFALLSRIFDDSTCSVL
jgi:hypothetical protein